jgi:hypothetical protein
MDQSLTSQFGWTAGRGFDTHHTKVYHYLCGSALAYVIRKHDGQVESFMDASGCRDAAQ